ncbi:MAG: ATP-grasp domain-containing protein [Actinobacteria bacterium]|nr:ATP-grasp domain-containing protein [Actinomycetota bacterium]
MEDGPRARPRLLVLGAGAAQFGLLRAARERDLHVLAVDRDPAAPGFRYADTRAVISTEDEPAIDRLARAQRIDGVISPGADWTVGIAARLAERLGLPHPIDGATAVLATSKSRQRERFATAGIAQPRLLDEPRVPCVVKAPDRQGQRGLTLVLHERDLPAAVATARAASRNGTFIAEEYVPGPEVTVNAVSLDGGFHPLTVTDRLTAEPPAFGVALAHAWPARLSVETTQALVGAARSAAEAVGIRNGPTYTQIRVGTEGPRVVELAARLGGGHDAELCELATGVRLNDLALDFALGRKVSVVPTQSLVGGACVLFLVAPEGELRAVEGVEEAHDVEGVAEVRIYRAPGWRFGPLLRGADRAGAILATGESRDDALERARRAAGAIRFVVE